MRPRETRAPPREKQSAVHQLRYDHEPADHALPRLTRFDHDQPTGSDFGRERDRYGDLRRVDRVKSALLQSSLEL